MCEKIRRHVCSAASGSYPSVCERDARRRRKDLLGLLFVSKAVAQSVTVEAKIDSLQILIGEQAKVQLQVAMDAKQRAIFPAYTDTLVRGVEIIETVKPDTQFLNDRQRMVITQEYIITSFDSALYYLPPMPVTVDGKVYNSKALALKVYSMPVDTLHPDQFFGQKTVMKAPFAWEDWYGLIACSFLALPLLGLLIYLIVRIRDKICKQKSAVNTFPTCPLTSVRCGRK